MASVIEYYSVIDDIYTFWNLLLSSHSEQYVPDCDPPIPHLYPHLHLHLHLHPHLLTSTSSIASVSSEAGWA